MPPFHRIAHQPPQPLVVSLMLVVCSSLLSASTWDGERCTNQCMQSLKQLGKIYQEGNWQQTPLSPTPRSRPLRPQQRKLNQHGQLQTVRGQYQANEWSQGRPHALTALHDWAAGIQVERSSFKITAIHPISKGSVRTRVLAGLYGTTPNGQRGERHATWTVDWQIANDEARISSLEASHYRACYLNSPPLFLDQSARLFHQAPDAWMQLRTPGPEWHRQMSNEVARTQNFYQGVSVADINGDGLEDVFVCQANGLCNRMLIQTPSGGVKDVSQQAGLDLLDRTRCAIFGDLDNDGDADLVLATTQAILIYSNNGSGRFTRQAALMDHFPSVFSISLADYDQDGRLDLYACNYYRNETQSRFAIRPAPDLFQDATNGGSNRLFRNTSRPGQLNFKDQTKISGLDQDNHHFSIASVWHDFDDDGDPDLYVANDFGKNQLYQNNQGTFRNVTETTQTQDQNFSMNAAWGDWNRDGKSDLYVSNMFSSAGKRITFQEDFKAGEPETTRRSIQHLSRGNSLFTQQAGNRFTEEAYPRGVWLGRWAWASRFEDLDHNGWQDLLVANGYITNQKQDDL